MFSGFALQLPVYKQQSNENLCKESTLGADASFSYSDVGVNGRDVYVLCSDGVVKDGKEDLERACIEQQLGDVQGVKRTLTIEEVFFLVVTCNIRFQPLKVNKLTQPSSCNHIQPSSTDTTKNTEGIGIVTVHSAGTEGGSALDSQGANCLETKRECVTWRDNIGLEGFMKCAEDPLEYFAAVITDSTQDETEQRDTALRCIAFLSWKKRGWIIKSGFKFGVDYVLYDAAVDIVHGK